ncbi:MAG TPA: DUF4412 domain-containing protein [Thermoanaerobaculia bacterium]|nr:DUF4412 domain-containing protein [Thermoanaerobaculia bacterium]
MNSRSAILLLLVLCIACKPAPKKAAAPAATPSGPTVRATVVTIRMTTQPGDKTSTHELLIGNGLVRSMDEIDVWRLFDTKANRVTFVDDIAQTYSTAEVPALAKARRAALAAPLPAEVPRAQFTVTGTKKALQGVQATQSLVKAGTYTRELWIGSHPAIPRGLYAAMMAARQPSSNIEPMARSVDEALLAVEGFPLAEHSELPLGNTKMTVDREVVAIGARDVPATMFEVPKGYRKM